MPARNELMRIAADHHPIISCEGTCEEIIVSRLVESDALIFPRDSVIDITRKRKSNDIQDEYLKFEYDWPVCIVRVLDSLRERFRLGTLYAERYPIVNIYTRPEIEMLIIIRENKYNDYIKQKSTLKPSIFCKNNLKLPHVKSAAFLQKYWSDTAEIVEAAIEYRRLTHLERGELTLADIIAADAKRG